MLSFFLALSLAAAFELSTGTLPFEDANAGIFPSLRVLQTPPMYLGEARAVIEERSCCRVHSYLPPSAFLAHCPSASCHASVLALPHVVGSAALPPHLKHPNAVLTPGGVWAAPPVRALRVHLAAGGLSGLSDFLGSDLVAFCPTCTLHAASMSGEHALITSLSSCPASARCRPSSPDSCGCTISAALLKHLTSYHAVLFVEPVTAPARALNAFQREITL